MIKKAIAVIAALVMVAGLSACNINVGQGTNGEATTSTLPITKIHNTFYDRLPEFKFKNTPTDKYDEGMSYTLTVECSEREYDKYIEAVKKNGFTVNAVEDSGYYTAYDGQGFFTEITRVGEMLTVFVKNA